MQIKLGNSPNYLNKKFDYRNNGNDDITQKKVLMRTTLNKLQLQQYLENKGKNSCS